MGTEERQLVELKPSALGLATGIALTEPWPPKAAELEEDTLQGSLTQFDVKTGMV